MQAVETIGAVATVLGIVVVVGKGLRGLLTAFHNEHVAPALTTVVHAIQTNTDETRALTSALARTNDAQERGFNRLGDIIADHETRITVLEQPPRPVKAARIRRSA
jgi:hypothetical protein